jgi:hypothetical protein
VDPRSDLDPHRPNAIHDRRRCADAARWSVERGEETVTSGIDLAAAKPGDDAADEAVMSLRQGSPIPIPDRRRTFR